MTEPKIYLIDSPNRDTARTIANYLTTHFQKNNQPVIKITNDYNLSDLFQKQLFQISQDYQTQKLPISQLLLESTIIHELYSNLQDYHHIGNNIVCSVSELTLLIKHFYTSSNISYTSISQIIEIIKVNLPNLIHVIIDNKEADESIRKGLLWEANQRHLPVINYSEDHQSVIEKILELDYFADNSNAPEPTPNNQHITTSSNTNHTNNLGTSKYTNTTLNNSSVLLGIYLKRFNPKLVDNLQNLIQQHQQTTSDTKDLFITPQELTEIQAIHYQSIITQMLDNYSELSQQLESHLKNSSGSPSSQSEQDYQTIKQQTFDILSGMIPVSVSHDLILRTTDISELTELKNCLIKHSIKEFQFAGHNIDNSINDKSETVQINQTATDTNNKYSDLLSKLPPKSDLTAIPKAPVAKLVSYSPRNELDLCSEVLYPNTQLTTSELNLAVQKLSYDQKQEILKAYLTTTQQTNQYKNDVLKTISYTWEIISDITTLLEMCDQFKESLISSQLLTTQLEYNIPPQLSDAGLEQLYIQNFALSSELYQYLSSITNSEIAQYAVLHGHNIRYKICTNGIDFYSKIIGLKDKSNNLNLNIIFKDMIEQVNQAHNITAGLFIKDNDLNAINNKN